MAKLQGKQELTVQVVILDLVVIDHDDLFDSEPQKVEHDDRAQSADPKAKRDLI